jgi:hypothetical protein
MGTGMNFYPRVRIQVQISTRSLFADGRVIALPDPNLTRCHPYVAAAKELALLLFLLIVRILKLLAD